MSHRRPSANSDTPAAASSVFDRVTLHAFMFTLTVVTAVVLSYGPAAAMHHIADVLASAGDVPIPPDMTWGNPIAF